MALPMIKLDFNIIKIDKSKYKLHFCSGKNCKRDPKYIETHPQLNNIKDGTMALEVSVIAAYNIKIYYCYDCIDDILNELKIKLNKNLWIFNED